MAITLMERIGAVLPPEVARLLMATVQGFLVQSLVFEDVTADLVAATSRAAFRWLPPHPPPRWERNMPPPVVVDPVRRSDEEA